MAFRDIPQLFNRNIATLVSELYYLARTLQPHADGCLAILNQPIWVLRAGSSPADELAAAILRCEGFPWLEDRSIKHAREIPPQVKLLVVVGSPIPKSAVDYIAQAVAGGTALIALTPDAELAGT